MCHKKRDIVMLVDKLVPLPPSRNIWVVIMEGWYIKRNLNYLLYFLGFREEPASLGL